MLEGFLSDDTEFDVYEENDEFVIENELEAEQEAETALLLGECDDMDDICDSDEECDDDPYYDEIDDDDDDEEDI